MKKFRMMLPVLAVAFAVIGAVAGDLLPASQGRYWIGATCSSLVNTDQNCFRSDDDNLSICTITPSGGTPQQAFESASCNGVLRYNE